MDQISNKLTPAELERLALLSEELGEAQQAIGKILRHGYESTSPFDATQTTNRQSLEKELGDVAAAMFLMTEAEDLNLSRLNKARKTKLSKVGQWLHFNEVPQNGSST